ncbi:uncharacterized protein DMAD_04582 [Drosophila madeirensis]|uniref:Uncharacterized protein n=1 Tax=Drosophila madeirensis TaxID=30013 RepID=A0AAU9GEA3_DROMD
MDSHHHSQNNVEYYCSNVHFEEFEKESGNYYREHASNVKKDRNLHPLDTYICLRHQIVLNKFHEDAQRKLPHGLEILRWATIALTSTLPASKLKQILSRALV